MYIYIYVYIYIYAVSVQEIEDLAGNSIDSTMDLSSLLKPVLPETPTEPMPFDEFREAYGSFLDVPGLRGDIAGPIRVNSTGRIFKTGMVDYNGKLRRMVLIPLVRSVRFQLEPSDP